MQTEVVITLFSRLEKAKSQTRSQEKWKTIQTDQKILKVLGNNSFRIIQNWSVGSKISTDI